METKKDQQLNDSYDGFNEYEHAYDLEVLLFKNIYFY